LLNREVGIDTHSLIIALKMPHVVTARCHFKLSEIRDMESTETSRLRPEIKPVFSNTSMQIMQTKPCNVLPFLPQEARAGLY
jgi:hypothetical protein